MDADKAIRDAMTDDERVEYDQLFKDGMHRHIERGGYIVTGCVAAAVVVVCVVALILADRPRAISPIPWVVALVMLLLIGLIVSKLLGSRFRRATETRRAEIIEAAAARLPGTPAPHPWEDDPHVRWVDHTPKGSWHPEDEYLRRRGRSSPRDTRYRHR